VDFLAQEVHEQLLDPRCVDGQASDRAFHQL
jgi:hypothetical protein